VLVISNLPTLDAYDKALTMESAFGGRLVYLVANQSVIAQFKPLIERGGSQTAEYGPETLLTPQSGVIDKISAARFRSAVAGSPARIIAQLAEPGDILPAAGTPFTQSLSGSGGVGAVGELAYVERVANFSPVGTEAAPEDLIDFGTLNFSPSPILFQFFSAKGVSPTTAGAEMGVSLWEDGVDIGRLALTQADAAGGAVQCSIYAERRRTPSAGNHHYILRAWKAGGAAGGTWAGGIGGAAAYPPMYGRIVTA
jgi:hypothetical protein